MVLPTRRMMKVMYSKRGIHKRRPLTLNECLDLKKPSERTLRHYLVVLLLIPCLYYLYWLISKPSTVVQYYTIVDKEYLENLGRNGSMPYLTMDLVKKEYTKTEKPDTGKPFCVVNIKQIGPIRVNASAATIPMNALNSAYPMVGKGGHYIPRDCRPRHKVAILVPYRNREKNLKIFLFNIHPFLMRQKLEYRMFIVEQTANETYNKGRLYNAGFKEAKKYGNWQCVVFHDVDLLPLDDRILYSCPTFPRHMCGSTIRGRGRNVTGGYPPRVLFGGVTVMSPAHFQQVNGYSNMYWGWGGEDNDMFWRIRSVGLPISRYNRTIALYTSMPHRTQKKNKYRFHLLHTAMERRKEEGLSTIEYDVVFVHEWPLFTHIMVQVNPYNENITETMLSQFNF